MNDVSGDMIGARGFALASALHEAAMLIRGHNIIDRKNISAMRSTHVNISLIKAGAKLFGADNVSKLDFGKMFDLYIGFLLRS